MESWENIILQWINCLNDSNDRIKTVEDLQDGKIYYNLINRIIPWRDKKSTKSQRDTVLIFLKEEYPNFLFKDQNSLINKLYIATLVLARLSLEPIFHKMLCDLDVEIQVKIKSILETVYLHDKSITMDDIYKIFSPSSKKNHKLLDATPTFVSDEFIEHSAVDDDIQLKQTNQMRLLKIQIETMQFENSDLVEDIAAQEVHIKDLQNKLQEALTELRVASADNFKLNSTSMDPKDVDVESICRKEESLEKYISKLQADNNQLQDQKKALNTEVKKLYREKYQILKENNENKKKSIKLEMQIKNQEKQIKDLENKLQVTSCASPKLNNSTNSSAEAKNLSKLKVLEKSLKELKTINCQLEQEKQALVIDELKLYKEKHYILKEKNENKKKAFEAVMLIKSQEKQINTLENKLKDLEKNVAKLKFKNYQLCKEKRELTDELKLYKGKHFALIEKKAKI